MKSEKASHFPKIPHEKRKFPKIRSESVSIFYTASVNRLQMIGQGMTSYIYLTFFSLLDRISLTPYGAGKSIAIVDRRLATSP